MTEQDRSVFVVVDFWRVRPGKRDALEQLLIESGPKFRRQPGVLSVDFTRLDDDPNRYLVVFRYQDAAAREAFVATEELKTTLARLSKLWDLDSPVHTGSPIERSAAAS
ncbi:MAG TPA: antibiotic biosynthesis monooxygenase family protein [Thermomicrobiales bacterium]|nr:antibiotic biosynthesis monooxygenase family protein [Thermomicrobiales bacterium]